ncbi:MAG: Ig-like domain-containing protein [Lachnospiraceae bacterium]|nr:Ig-like domain-containing protein [Lachnospiraceae bacterium]
MKKAQMKRIVRILLVSIMMTTTFGIDVRALEIQEPVLLVDNEYESADTLEEEDIIGEEDIIEDDDSLSSNDILIETSDDVSNDSSVAEDDQYTPKEINSRTGGYREFPRDYDIPVIGSGTTYDEFHDEIGQDGMAIREDDAKKWEQQAFPYSYYDKDKIEEYLKANYPDPKDQGDEGTCWAVAVTGVNEFYMLTHGLGKMTDPDMTCANDIDYSELHLNYWTYTKGTPSLAGDTGDNVSMPSDLKFSYGGNPIFAAQTLMQWRGVVQEETEPYTEENIKKAKTDGLSSENEFNDVAHLKNYYILSVQDRDLAKQAIVANGSVAISVGVYDEYINGVNGALCSSINSSNHMAVIVGWDDNYPRENFRSSYLPEKNGAWLVRNSWTTETTVGDICSYFWLSYEDKSLKSYNVYEMMDPGDDVYDNNYFYDSQIHDVTNYNSNDIPGLEKTANIYKAGSGSDKETLQAVMVGVFPDLEDVEYTIDIYKGVTPEYGPESGELQESATTTGTMMIGGSYTIPLKEPVVLDKDEYFSVVVSLKMDGVNYTPDLEYDFDLWEGLECTVSANDYQSFIKVGDEWHYPSVMDLYTDEKKKANLIIHALTANGEKGGSVSIAGSADFGSGDKAGDIKTLTVTVTDKDADPVSDPEVFWKSSDTEVVTVDQNGNVKAVGNGEATVTASYDGRSDSIKVTVALKKHTVTLNANGGIFEVTDAIGNISYKESVSIIVYNGGTFTVDDPLRTGYRFEGWYDGNTKYETATGVTEDKELTAGWSIDSSVEDIEYDVYPQKNDDNKYEGDIKVKLYSDTEGASIYYTLNSDDPIVSEDKIPYTGRILIDRELLDQYGSDADDSYKKITIKAYGEKEGYNNSSVKTYDFFVKEADPYGAVVDADKCQYDGLTDKGKAGLWLSEASCSSNMIYTGEPLTYENLRVYYGNSLLTEGTDYSVKYSNNQKASGNGRAQFRVTLKGNYSGNLTKKYKIMPMSLADTTVSADDINPAYTGKAQKPVPVVVWKGKTLSEKNDYSVSYYDAEGFNSLDDPGKPLKAVKEAGSYKAVISGKGNYTDKKVVSLEIKDTLKPIAVAKLTGFKKNVPVSINGIPAYQDSIKLTYNGTGLKKDTDYRISYLNADGAGKATLVITGCGDYTGVVKKAFTIKPLSIKKATLTGFEEIVDHSKWSESEQSSHDITQGGISISYAGIPLTENVDYKVIYTNNAKAGKATMKIAGIGDFNGSFSKKFTIPAHSIVLDGYIKNVEFYERNMYYPEWYSLSDNEISLNGDSGIGVYYYSKGGARPELIIRSGSTVLAEGKDYTLSFKNCNKYQTDKISSVTIKGKGLYSDSVTVRFMEFYNNTMSDDTVTITVSDMVRNKKKSKSLYQTPVVKEIKTGKKLIAGKDFAGYNYKYLTDTLLSNGTVRRANETVRESDILAQGCETTIEVTAVGGQTNDYNTYYEGSISTTYRVIAGLVSKASVVINNKKAYQYTGFAIEPDYEDMVVKIGKQVLTPKDYVIESYENNTNAGTARLTIRGVGKYGGTKTVNYTITILPGTSVKH